MGHKTSVGSVFWESYLINDQEGGIINFIKYSN